MSEKKLAIQVEALNAKMDLVLEEINRQRLKREEMNDLAEDVSIIGKDLYQTTVKKLDEAGVEISGEELEKFGLKLIRNIHTFNEILNTVESVNDLVKDLGPIIKQTGLDAIYKLHELEQKGYFEFIKEVSVILDNIIAHYSIKEVRELADNIVLILETIRNITQPDMLKAINNAVGIFKSLDLDHIEEYSLWRAFRELNSKEGKKMTGIVFAILKNLAQINQNKN